MEFDWYSGTLREEPKAVVEAMAQGEDLVDVLPCRALNGYRSAVEIRRGSERLSAVQWGGNGGTVHVFGSGPAAVRVADVLRARFPEHGVTRADVREDFDGEGVFDELFGLAVGIADEFGVKVRHVGDYHRCEDGRTVYVGSRKSPVQLRVYEKGRQLPEYGKPHWVRSELMVLPAKGAQRRAFAVAVPAAFYGASRWSRAYFERSTGCEVSRMASGTEYRKSDDERARAFMLRQYGPVLERWAGEVGGWANLGAAQEAALSAVRAEDGAREAYFVEKRAEAAKGRREALARLAKLAA